MRFGLKDDTIEAIAHIFSQYDQVDEVIIFGSRAKGTFKPASDIDLAVKGKLVDVSISNQIANKLDDLLLPVKFDLAIFDHISNPDLIDHIKRVGAIFFMRDRRGQ